MDVWIPGIGADLELSKLVSVFAGLHKGFSPPGVQPGTLPESSINYELGVRVERTGLNVQLIGFLNNYSEMLGSDLAAAGGSGTGDLFNAGKAVVQGVEFYANWDVLNGLSTRMRMPLSVAYTFTDARFGSSFNSSFEPWGNVLEGDRIPYTPTHQINGRPVSYTHLTLPTSDLVSISVVAVSLKKKQQQKKKQKTHVKHMSKQKTK